ncbi:MAG TPA: plastocyanin/azurin family copper-binding protein [Gemmatimonadaceae bacterium]|nr:plastocyanin/azurin family copper-binding protein [Gemmatimonadaceae bacterium]
MRIAPTMLALTLALAAAGCGGGGLKDSTSPNPTPHPGPSPGPSNGVTVSNNQFSPASTSVPVGTTVTWTWNSCSNDPYSGQTCVSHNVTFDDGTSSQTQSSGSFSRTFTTAGTYRYHCTIHGTAMSGTVQVQ